MSMAAILKDHQQSLRKRINIGIGIAISLITFATFTKSCSKDSDGSYNSFLTGARMVPAPVLVSVSDTLNKDSLLQVEYGKYIDSVFKHTTISQFNEFVESNVSVKDYPSLKFTDAMTAFIRQQQQLFLKRKQK